MDDDDLALRIALDRIARAVLGAQESIDVSLGQVTLHPHQLTAVARLLEILSSFRGALLADAVGLGKTYVGLAAARELGAALVICPAALRPMWARAMERTGVVAPVISTEALSRGADLHVRGGLVIVDEAHHFRTAGTRRYESLAHLVREASVLLMSATPLQNSRRDLISLLALFGGSSVKSWSDDAIARLIVRRDEKSADQRMPALSGPHALAVGDDEQCLEAILGLPPAIPAADEGVAHALATMTLLHLWSSSRAALVASVRKRLARATALRDAIAGGHVPTSNELSAWQYADESLQLALPLFAANASVVDCIRLDFQLEEFIAAAATLIGRCRESPDPDVARVELIRRLRERHAGARIVAFSQYAHTISALGRLMRAEPGIALATANGARIASGTVPREEVLGQFAGGAAEPRPVERIDLLLTTDLLSEGIDLRGASVVVNLDLPWNPARLEQRIGRARRLGSPFEVIHVYSMLPPAPAERVLQLRRRLTSKLDSARAVVGGDFDPFGESETSPSAVGDAEAMRTHMRSWVNELPPVSDACPIAAAAAPFEGWIAVVVLGGTRRLIADRGEGIVQDPRQLMSVAHGIGRAIGVDRARAALVIDQIAAWLDVRDACAGSGEQPTEKRALLERLAQTVARAPRHRRATVLATAQRTRDALATIRGIGGERVMATLARSPADDDAWLQSVETFANQQGDRLAGRPAADRLLALVLLERLSPEVAATPGRCARS